jgi:hypothetical protein
MKHQEVKSPELKAKQERLLQISAHSAPNPSDLPSKP